MKSIVKAHPLMLLSNLKSILLLGLFSGVFSVIKALVLKDNIFFNFYDILLPMSLIIIAELRRRSLFIELYNDYLIIRRGIYFKSESVVYKEKIISVYIKANPIERLFSAKTVLLNTMADKKNKCDLRVVVFKNDAERLKSFIKTDDLEQKRKFSVFRLLLWAVVSSSAFEGLLIFTPTARKTAKIFGIELYDTFFTSIIDKLSFTDKYLPDAVNTITAIFLFIYLLSFFTEFLKNCKFRLIFSKKSLSVKSGIVVKRETVLNSEPIVGYCAEQSIFMRMLGRYNFKAVTGGYNGRFSTNALIAPAESRFNLENTVDSLGLNYKSPKSAIKKVKARRGVLSALALPIFWGLLMVLATLWGISLFSELKRLIIFFLLVGTVFLAIYSYILLYGYKNSKTSFQNGIVAVGTNKLKVKRLFLKNDGIGQIKIRQNPFDRKRGSCRVILTAYSKNNEKIVVRWINKNDFTEKTNNIE